MKWKPVVEFNGYKVSDTGLIWSDKKNDYLTPWKHQCGYLCVDFSENGKTYHRRVHRVVLESFVGKSPKGKNDCNHIDGNKANNNVDNLKWCTRSENLKHAYDMGLKVALKGIEHKSSKMNEKQIKQILKDKEHKRKYSDVYNEYKDIISLNTFNCIWTRKTWKHIQI